MHGEAQVLGCATPAGAEYTYAPLADRTFRHSLKPYDDKPRVMSGEELEPIDVRLRLADGQPGRRDGGGRPVELPVRAAGS